jgi:hypothetical protein
MDTEFFRQLYKYQDKQGLPLYLIDTSKWIKKPNSIYYIDEDGDNRLWPADSKNLQVKIAKERKKAEDAAEKALDLVVKRAAILDKAKPNTKAQQIAFQKYNAALSQQDEADAALQIFLIPVAQNVRADDPFVNYPIVPFVNYPKQLKKAATSRLKKKQIETRALQRGTTGLKASLSRARGRISARNAETRALQRSTIGLKAALSRARGRISARNTEKRATTAAAQKRAARKRATENRKLNKLIALQEEVEQEFPDLRNDSERWAVELSHKLHPKSKTTPIGRDYFRQLGKDGCLQGVDNDPRYSYLCNKLNKPKKRAAAGLSGAGTNMVNLPEYRRAINSLRN